MDVVERLTPDQAEEVSLIAMTHRHRYELAAELFAGMRVLDLGCGSGYGSEVLATTAASVVGVDVDAGALADARRGYGGAGITFEEGDAIELLGTRLADRFDAIVMFEALEHVSDVEATTRGPAPPGRRRLTARGLAPERHPVRRGQPVPQDRVRPAGRVRGVRPDRARRPSCASSTPRDR